MKQKQILSPGELTSLKEEKQELESTLRAVDDGVGAGTIGAQIDKSALKRQVSHLDRTIKDGSPVSVKPIIKDRLAARADELREQIMVGMPNSDEMRRPARHPGVVRRNFEWNRRNSKAIAEYKQIMRQLEPGDPSASSIEKFRRVIK